MDNGVVYDKLRLQHFDGRLLHLQNGWGDTKKERYITEMWLILDGGGFVHIDGKEYRLKKGDFCFFPDTLAAEYGCDRDCLTMQIVGLESNLLSGSLVEWLDCSEWVVPLSAADFNTCLQLMQAVAV